MTRRVLRFVSRGSFLALGILGLLPPSAFPEAERKVTTLADGVYAIEHPDAGDGFASGNTTVIVGSRQVLVVDSGFLPSVAREDIGQIRGWTDKPVAFLLNTHFHNDHNLANRTYLEAFPALTIIAHVETKKDMDRFGPSSAARVEKSNAQLERLLKSGKTDDGRRLTADEKTAVKAALDRRLQVMGEIEQVSFQSATLTFDHDFTVDLGGREVEIRFLGRGNTAGDAVAYLPKERILAAGDLVVSPIPYIYDGYPSEWAGTLENVLRLGAKAIVPGHGPVLHDTAYVSQVQDLLKSAVSQLDAELVRIGPAMSVTLDEAKKGVDLAPFRPRFAGENEDLKAAFDDMASHLVEVAFDEARLR